MTHRRIAMTGPYAAGVYGLDGFRDIDWPELWCAPIGGESGDRIVRTRRWDTPVDIADIRLCPIETVVRHLNAVPLDLSAAADRLAPVDRVELAVEHALRDGVKVRAARGRGPGDKMLHEVLRRRGNVVPTESYAETRAVQLLRTWDVVPWRQIPILRQGRIEFRADFMIPFKWQRRPETIRSSMGLLVEVDSREFHAGQFERDQHRGAVYNELGYHWITVTPNQIEHEPALVRRSLAGALNRAGSDLLPSIDSRVKTPLPARKGAKAVA
jgi:very-short-patch-repair endonuclease